MDKNKDTLFELCFTLEITREDVLAAIDRAKDRYGSFTVLETPMPFSKFQSGNKINLVQVHAVNVCICSDGTEYKCEEPMFCGVFEWDGETAHSLDGDTYNQDAIVYAYEWFNDDDGDLCLDIITGEGW